MLDSEEDAEGAGQEALLDVCNTRLCCLWSVVPWRDWFRNLRPSERRVAVADAVADAGFLVVVVVSGDVALLAGPCVGIKPAAAEVCHPEWTQHRRADRRPARGDMQQKKNERASKRRGVCVLGSVVAATEGGGGGGRKEGGRDTGVWEKEEGKKP